MPTGKVKFFDAEKGFGFVSGDDGQQVYLPASSLPDGIDEVRPGTRVEYGVADGRRGPSALNARVLDAPPSIARRQRRKPEEMAVIVEDVIRMLDDVSNDLRRGYYPGKAHGGKVAQVLRRIADSLDA